MSNNKKFHKRKSNPTAINADFRLKIEKEIEKFVNSSDSCYEFPSSLTNVERAFVHNLAPKYNLKTRSFGKDENRRLTVFKLSENQEFRNKTVKIDMDPIVVNLLQQFQMEYPTPKTTSTPSPPKQINAKPRALSKPPVVPPPSSADFRIQSSRQKLPIFDFRDKILETINNNRVVLIQGSTGSGKTTQIPQYIMEEACEKSLPCRILCTQPRRISAIASCERVCYERSQVSGSTIGYQIRLESSISDTTNCIFLTPGVFLRYLMSGKLQELFYNITHILIDEAHERAKENDFLLTSIKENLDLNPNLKLIIMSATMDTGVFSKYFGGCEEVAIATRQFDVQEYYLEDILRQVKYRNRQVDELNEAYKDGKVIGQSKSAYLQEESIIEEEEPLDDETVAYINEVLEDLTTSDTPESEFEQFMYLVQAENVPVDARHTTTKMTALMIAVGRGILPSVESLLNLKADPKLKVLFGDAELSCLDIAYKLHGSDSEIFKLIQQNMDSNSQQRELTSEDLYNKALLNIYYDSVNNNRTSNFILEESIDHELMVKLVEQIHEATPLDGGILVFLPGYDDILTVANMIGDRLKNNHSLFMLHSSMKTEDQKNVFKEVVGRRKIILSTNIAESSITIDDVVYVIDSGREKQKSYDAISHSSSLQVQWISKASANQRKGRAGRIRNGLVFRVYSRDRYKSMLETTIPELLRTSLTEICLQAKLMIQDSSRIEEFLRKCIAAPSIASIRESIKFLQSLGALDQNEKLTLLGSHLAEMPVDAKYAKMLIYGIIFRCVDPVLSIVSILSMGDQIFVLPVRPSDRFKAHQIRKSLGENSLSDHFVMLRIYNLWNQRRDRKFCEENFINSVAMERVKGIRHQISNYLQTSGLMRDGFHFLNTNSEKWPVVKACLCAGLYPSVARIDRSKALMYSEIDQKLLFHMSSILGKAHRDRSMDFVKKFPVDWVVFEEKNRFGRMTMIRNNTLIDSFSLSLSAGAGLTDAQPVGDDGDWTDEDEEPDELITFKIDNLVTLSAEKESGELIVGARRRLDNLIVRFLSSKSSKIDRADEVLVQTLANAVGLQEKRCGFGDVKTEGGFDVMQRGGNGTTTQNSRNSNGKPPQNRNNSSGNQNWRQDYNSTPQNAKFNNQRIPQAYSFHTNIQQQSNPRPGPSRNPQQNMNAAPTFFNQSRHTRQKFFVLKINETRKLSEWSSMGCVKIEELRLGNWLMDRLYSGSMNTTNIVIIFYSTSQSEFKGFGDITPAQNHNQPVMFQMQHICKYPMQEARQKFMFRNLNLFQNPKFKTEELSVEIGSALLDLLRS